MMAESDGIDEELRAALQLAVTAAARLGEQAVRAREQRSRDAQARSGQEAREDAARFVAERDAARASLAPVHRADWWDAAQTQDVVQAYQSARAWAEADPEAERAEQRIVQELRDRYGLDASSDLGSVHDAIERAEHERGQGRGDELEAASLMATADEADRRAQEAAKRAELAAATGARAEEAEDERARQDGNASSAETMGAVAYDSAERREALAQHLEGAVDNKAAVQARVRSDASQGRPATEATRRASAKSARTRRTRATVSGRQAQREERGR